MLNPNWAQLAGTIFLGLVGLWLAYNYRRQVRLKLVDRQVDTYMALWKITAIAAHTRTTPLDQPERQKLYDEMTRWYHDDANGILVSMHTRNLFLAYQHNLTCSIDDMEPRMLADQLSAMSMVDAERRRGCISIRHATLLRNQLKADLVLHSGFVIYYKNRSDDRAFLRSCGLSPWRHPWRSYRLPSRNEKTGICVCGMCPP
jgi:hypothetical protein